MNTTVSPRIMKIYEAYKAKKEAIDSANAGHYVTTGIFKKSHSSTPINIKSELDNNVLVGILSGMLMESKHHEEAAAMLGVKSELKFNNCKMESWVKDLKTRITQLSIAKETKELEQMHADIMQIAPNLFEEIRLQEMEDKLNLPKETVATAATEEAKA